MRDILTHARRFPMGSTRQVVIVKEAQELQDLHRESDSQLLEAYIKAPQPSTLLVWAYKYKTLDARKSLRKVLDHHAVLMDSRTIYDNQVGPWIGAYVQEKGLKITEKAAIVLQTCVGNDLQCLANELDKLCTNLTPENVTINDTLVHTYVGESQPFNTFAFQKALARRDSSTVYKIVLRFEKNIKHHQVIPLVTLLFTFFSKLLLLHHVEDKSEPALAKVLQVHPYFVREYILAGKCYPLPKVVANIQHLYQADLQLKGVGYPPVPEGQVLKELVARLLENSIPT
jgi:DNA polymerase-3 subunit delta